MSFYCPGNYTSTNLKDVGVTQYQEMVGVFRLAVNLGQVGILLETALMSTYLALPHRENIEQLSHVFGYFKEKLKRYTFFDPHHLTINDPSFAVHDWYEL